MSDLMKVENPVWEKVGDANNRLYGSMFIGEYNADEDMVKALYISKSKDTFFELERIGNSLRSNGESILTGGLYEEFTCGC